MCYFNQKGGVNKKGLSQFSIPARKFILSSCPSLQPQLGPEAFEILNNMVHASNPNYRYNVKLAEKIHPRILSKN